ncbi:hypothetical protein GCM10011490_11140 [Pseudoclavibacter endophyticus]|uniref:DUF2236 domain-containing protein n=1 Tax=Pseudoclavibacter endophyticus TaxID=1778590 RepID=A0A6H9WEV6_9MICO|nr:oxygenase MpaB family protein [Pseudoclavibacter endophyticus]KAB1649459.1 DUF2236 domain-containing protein [Pseudoclavibacter endophyticus]GGA62485.1 hypothetical protein GCM10011490_11140 [Pseudoclavibacter endophyticus]
MTDTTAEQHPSRALGDAPRADDGHYGPGSVSWRVFADPASGIGGKTALFLQMLDAGMMTHFERVSSTSEGPEAMAARFDRTSAYLRDAVFADRAHAEAAAKHVDMLHERATWTDPKDGHVEIAKVPEWQRWTWWTYIWSAVRGYQEFGPEPLSTADADQLVVESRIGAEQLKVPGPFFETFAELDAYINSALTSKALVYPAALVAHTLRRPEVKGLLARWGAKKLIDGMVYLMPTDARLFFAMEDRTKRQLESGRAWTKRIVKLSRGNKSAEELIATMIGDSEKHPYRKVRARVAAAS